MLINNSSITSEQGKELYNSMMGKGQLKESTFDEVNSIDFKESIIVESINPKLESRSRVPL